MTALAALHELALSPHELELIVSVFRKHPEVSRAKVFGSRAKGNSTPISNVDLALWGGHRWAAG